jgi:hypothetical protein
MNAASHGSIRSETATLLDVAPAAARREWGANAVAALSDNRFTALRKVALY